MGSGPDGQDPAAGSGAGNLRRLIVQRLSGGDFPPGALLLQDRLAHLFEADAAAVSNVLDRLAAEGRVEPLGQGRWRVVAGAQPTPADALRRLAPVLRAIVGLAAPRITPREAAGLLAAYDVFAGLAGNGSDQARAEGYDQLLRRLAAASGSAFHAQALEQLLPLLAPLTARLVAHHAASARDRSPDDGLARLARALMASSPMEAEAALADHLVLMGRLAA